ncbi:MAG: hypothetical protein ABSD13_14520 [Candidatus Korobacteraceae bacterium]|jgi:hypothetical protein
MYIIKLRQLRRLNHECRLAIQEFWMTYLRALGAKLHWVIDGVGSLERFLQQQPDTHGPDQTQS